jgi:hypothetical protein
MKTAGTARLTVDRRTTIKWLAATMVASAPGCSTNRRFVGEEIPALPEAAGTLLGQATQTAMSGYGGDPDLLNPAPPWSRTMTRPQLDTCAALCDVILPADERSPAASEVGVHEFIDEWISAPYPQQQRDRESILANLEWLEARCRERFGSRFADAADSEQEELVAGIATASQEDGTPDPRRRFFARVRYLAVGAFYTTQAGIADIGYIGNVPIDGDYPGPSEEALEHLAGVLRELGLPSPN